jgi:hypothetical protein
MAKKTFSNKLLLVTVICLALVMSSTDAFARDRDRGRPHEVVIVGHERYHYRDGRFYRPGWFGFEFFLAKPPIGAIVTTLPFGYTTIIVGGLPYYYYDHVYYRAHASGFTVVPAPVVNSNVVYALPAIPYQASSAETVTVNVPNSNGSYTSVTLVKRNNGYIGPQGEYYPAHPTVDQLKALYGK